MKKKWTGERKRKKKRASKMKRVICIIFTHSRRNWFGTCGCVPEQSMLWCGILSKSVKRRWGYGLGGVTILSKGPCVSIIKQWQSFVISKERSVSGFRGRLLKNTFRVTIAEKTVFGQSAWIQERVKRTRSVYYEQNLMITSELNQNISYIVWS